jgi:hypothetical protein
MPANELQDPRVAVTGGGPSRTAVAAGVDLSGVGQGPMATLTVAATRTKATVAAAGSSTALLTAKTYSDRFAATITNSDTAQTLWLGFGTAAVVGTGISIAPGKSWSWSPNQDPASGLVITPAQLNGAINGIWTGSPTGNAYITETVA